MSDTQKKQRCLQCNGTGNYYHPQPEGVIGYLPCPTCDGSGIQPQLLPDDIIKVLQDENMTEQDLAQTLRNLRRHR